MTDEEFDIWFEALIKKIAEEDKEILIGLS
jgi:hypothetical protein